MKARKVILPLVLIAFISPILLLGQSVTNQVATVYVNEKDGRSYYKISYDLVAPFDNIACVVKVKLVKRAGTSSPLVSVTGDVGNLVLPGRNKTIFWDYSEELIHFSGDINLSIEVEPAVNVETKIRRNKNFSVQLAPGYQEKKNYTVTLFRRGKELNRLQDISLNQGSFTSTIPKKTKTGKNYQLAINDGNQTYFSNAFILKPKVNRVLIILPFVAITAYLANGIYESANAPLPGPPKGN